MSLTSKCKMRIIFQVWLLYCNILVLHFRILTFYYTCSRQLYRYFSIWRFFLCLPHDLILRVERFLLRTSSENVTYIDLRNTVKFSSHRDCPSVYREIIFLCLITLSRARLLASLFVWLMFPVNSLVSTSTLNLPIVLISVCLSIVEKIEWKC